MPQANGYRTKNAGCETLTQIWVRDGLSANQTKDTGARPCSEIRTGLDYQQDGEPRRKGAMTMEATKNNIAAVGYARRSTDMQERSIPDQQAYVERWAKCSVSQVH